MVGGTLCACVDGLRNNPLISWILKFVAEEMIAAPIAKTLSEIGSSMLSISLNGLLLSIHNKKVEGSFCDFAIPVDWFKELSISI